MEPPRVLGDAHALLRICGRAASMPREGRHLWICDAWLLLTKRPTLGRLLAEEQAKLAALMNNVARKALTR